MKRIALFAHYDRDGIVDDYVVYYLRGLTGVAQRILFVSDCELRPGEAAKLEGLAELVFAERHGEYDFGSWKRCFAYLGEALSDWDEVILANDSCYAPVFPFEDIFDRMGKSSCDFWSPTATHQNGSFDHANSYFIVLRRPILSDSVFLDFWTQITAQQTKKGVIDSYEIGLSRLLVQRGYRWDSVAPMSKTASFLKREYLRHELPKFRLSWIKVNLLRYKPHRLFRLGSRLSAIGCLYPRRLIDTHILRMFNSANPSRARFFFGAFLWAPNGGRVVAVRGKVKEGRWWKFYAYLFGVPVFAFVLPRWPRRVG